MLLQLLKYGIIAAIQKAAKLIVIDRTILYSCPLLIVNFNINNGKTIPITNISIKTLVFLLKNLSIAVYFLAILAAMRVIVKTKANIAASACEIALNKYKIPSLAGAGGK